MMFADASVSIVNSQSRSPIVLVCEHASHHIPEAYSGLGLEADAARSHAAWDPGADGVAREMSRLLNAPLVRSNVSRLVYDCNRPPHSPTAICETSEIYDVPGNRNLTPEARAHRVETVYRPFRAALRETLASRKQGVLVTVHSFTPVYHGRKREVELGILHDRDTRLADAMLAGATRHTDLVARRNEPYAPRDGVTHTLAEHALPRGWPNVMLEIRNDLIDTEARQTKIARQLRALLIDALDRMAFDPLPVSIAAS
ncbi:N-formylglutamate amidohydrolase [Roseibium sp.]|uniref:N-formylglutamate amidohydrolase n=1 Tax=Roseibium sp. TaxID=1936156 RepID=UPI003D0BC44A